MLCHTTCRHKCHGFSFPQSQPQVLPLSLPATKPKKSGFLSCAGPSAGGFTIPLATVLGQFGPKSNYECLYYLATFKLYVYNNTVFRQYGLPFRHWMKTEVDMNRNMSALMNSATQAGQSVAIRHLWFYCRDDFLLSQDAQTIVRGVMCTHGGMHPATSWIPRVNFQMASCRIHRNTNNFNCDKRVANGPTISIN